MAKVLDQAERSLPKSPQLQQARALVAVIRHRYSDAVNYYDRALALLPARNRAANASELYARRASAHALNGSYRAARTDLETAIALDKNNFIAHNNYAWLLGTCPDGSIRDGKRAVQFARAASQRLNNNNAMLLDTLAAAEAESGDFRSAVKDEKHALSLAKGDHSLYDRHLQSYISAAPVRETPQPPSTAELAKQF